MLCQMMATMTYSNYFYNLADFQIILVELVRSGRRNDKHDFHDAVSVKNFFSKRERHLRLDRQESQNKEFERWQQEE